MTRLIRVSLLVTSLLAITLIAACKPARQGEVSSSSSPPSTPSKGDDFKQGLAQWEQGNLDAAIALLTKVLQRNPRMLRRWLPRDGLL